MPLTREEARDFKERWALVNAVTLEESRKKTLAERLREAAELMVWAQSLPDPRREEEVEAVRARWMRLHRLAGG
jgi:hypothetical protein